MRLGLKTRGKAEHGSMMNTETNDVAWMSRCCDAGASFVEATAWTRGEKRRLEHGDKLRKVISSIKYTDS